ncbi:putative protein kinase superfamily protein [Panicum miliaceum]|uniref:Serine-threonine/tyrosine-protein kinase catalytic domain-containing protein n=1 Tax=Panicum miliaceum TaxID=4540 RepID=A0A3L6PK81_PANMI|nr:putative protein kinase superfamily protein [Panicum miliaceum]
MEVKAVNRAVLVRPHVEIRRNHAQRKKLMMSRKKSAGGAPWRRNSDESVSPRCVLDDGCATSSNSSGTTTTTMGTSSAGAAANTTTFPAATATTYAADAPASARQDGPPPWKAVAEAWRSRAKRQLSGRIPPLGPAVSSTLRRLSVRRPPEPDRAEEEAGADRMEGFLSELGHVVNVSHPNIARLVGVGVDGGEHLVFPFSRLGCLSGMLHGSGGAEPMPWEASSISGRGRTH